MRLKQIACLIEDIIDKSPDRVDRQLTVINSDILDCASLRWAGPLSISAKNTIITP
jgi:hypothetical protein